MEATKVVKGHLGFFFFSKSDLVFFCVCVCVF